MLRFEVSNNRRQFQCITVSYLVQVVREALAGLRPLLCSEDMEAQERAHNASALLSAVLRRLNPDDAALAAPDSPEAIAATDLVNTLLDHEHRLVY